jgi:hypothetical protein
MQFEDKHRLERHRHYFGGLGLAGNDHRVEPLVGQGSFHQSVEVGRHNDLHKPPLRETRDGPVGGSRSSITALGSGSVRFKKGAQQYLAFMGLGRKLFDDR